MHNEEIGSLNKEIDTKKMKWKFQNRKYIMTEAKEKLNRWVYVSL